MKKEDVASFAVLRDKKIEPLQKKYNDAIDKYQQAVGRLQMAITDSIKEHQAAYEAKEDFQAASAFIDYINALVLYNFYSAQVTKFNKAADTVKTNEQRLFLKDAKEKAAVRASVHFRNMQTAQNYQDRYGRRALYFYDMVKQKEEKYFDHLKERDNYKLLAGRAIDKFRLSTYKARVADKKAGVAQAMKVALLKKVEDAKQELEAARGEKPTHGP
ncbi:uncharacterized protein PHALS_02812 [Plasmopara halstedii]|uniref:Uncharacterized protein n=1 Tax=Plasmopara halstedii TaxID=4781 RepID=A0A0P1AX66_PLAHL|nr:uncharacterized protein PHALS_02812 [Plasmopara halstedii]CEG46409.1 hypothetical protein PHALS_02812 [Plasmopara halstedii]|eukprot:XP_024582778.1 hypothetical protein PHALS_02812 [Plasmopara halstedii]